MEMEKATLEVESKQFSLTQGKIYLVGCAKEVQSEVEIALQDESLDAKHAVVEVCQDVVFIVDLHSKLGTYLNGVRLEAMSKVSVNGETTLRFGTVEGLLRIGSNEKSLDSSGFHEEPNKTASSPKLHISAPRIDEDFVVPPAPATDRNSLLAETNASLETSATGDKSNDSFIIPETQHRRSRSLFSVSAGDASIAASDKSCFDGAADVDESFIPETQQPAPATSNRPLQSSPSDDDTVNANMPKSMESNQIFRICTQDFNEDLFGEEVDADSHVLFGILQSSLVIPKIQHEPVVLDELPRPQQPEIIEGDEINKLNADKSGDADMAALNWSASASKSATLNETAKSAISDEHGSCCTPDLLDLPELAHANAQANNTADPETVQGNQACAEEFDPTSNKIVVKVEVVENEHMDTSDMSQTQVFKRIARPEQQENVPLEELSLSGKENVLPSALANIQLFVPREVFANDRKVIGDNQKQEASPSINSIENPLEEGATQVFPLKRSERTANSNKEKMANSTLICELDGQTKSSISFFEDIERTPQKTDAHGEEKNKKRSDFHKSTSNKPSTTTTAVGAASSSVNSVQPEPEYDLEMCTPKWIRDKFEVLSQEQNIIASKPRVLFEPDPDEDVGDLNFLGKEKISNDFDRLLSHVNTDPVCSPEKKSSDATLAAQPKKITQRMQAEVDKKSSLKDKEKIDKEKGRKRDENESSAASSASLKEPKIHSRSSKDRCSRSTSAEVDKKSSLKDKERIDMEKGRKRDGNESSATSSTSLKESKIHSRSSKDKRARSTSVDLEIATPARRSTRLKSRIDELAQIPQIAEADGSRLRSEHIRERAPIQRKVESEHRRARTDWKESAGQLHEKAENDSKHLSREKVKNNHRATRNTKKESAASEQTIEPRSKPDSSKSNSTANNTSNEMKKLFSTKNESISFHVARKTRSRSKTESQESVSSSTSSRSAQLANDRKRKTATAAAAGPSERKRLRSTSSKGTTSAASSSGPRKLQVSMTMVDPQLFAELAANSSGIWTIAKEPTESDVLIMDKGNRTLKFLIAMAKGIPIVTSKWLACVNETKRVPKGTEYLFGDAAFERRHKFSLLKSQDMARKHKIFEGYEFLMTPSILPQPSDMKQIITCAGGTLLIDPPSPKDNQKLYLISTSQDAKYWHKYRRRNSNMRIISSEGVMAAVMQQHTKPLEIHVLC